MTIIGAFTVNDSGSFIGVIETLTFKIKAIIRAVDSDSEKAPDFRIATQTIEFGAAWKKTNRDGRNYLSVKLDDPSLPAPIYATLVQANADGAYDLIWSR